MYNLGEIHAALQHRNGYHNLTYYTVTQAVALWSPRRLCTMGNLDAQRFTVGLKGVRVKRVTKRESYQKKLRLLHLSSRWWCPPKHR